MRLYNLDAWFPKTKKEVMRDVPLDVPETVGKHAHDLQERLDAEFSREIVELGMKHTLSQTSTTNEIVLNCELSDHFHLEGSRYTVWDAVDTLHE